MRNVTSKYFRSLLRYSLELVGLYPLLGLRLRGPLYEDGWFRSYREKMSINLDGDPIPWVTYPAIAFLNMRVNESMSKFSVFEFGSGNSTLWWSRRVAHVTSCEHDESWYKIMQHRIPSNVDLRFVGIDDNTESYANEILRTDRMYDIIIIDGMDRVKCAITSVKKLKNSGVIIWDNSNRDDYIDGFRFLSQNSFKRIEFEGYAPISLIKSETSVFYKDVNCFGI